VRASKTCGSSRKRNRNVPEREQNGPLESGEISQSQGRNLSLYRGTPVALS